MRGLYPLWRAAALAWWRWAARSIDPLHPDAPMVHRRVYDLERADEDESNHPWDWIDAVGRYVLPLAFLFALALALAASAGLFWRV